jgi:hypothetical protein
VLLYVLTPVVVFATPSILRHSPVLLALRSTIIVTPVSPLAVNPLFDSPGSTGNDTPDTVTPLTVTPVILFAPLTLLINTLGNILGVGVNDGVNDGVTVIVGVVVGVNDGVTELDTVILGVTVGVAVLLGVIVGVIDILGVNDGLVVIDGVTLGVSDGLVVIDGVTLGVLLGVTLGVLLGVILTVFDGVMLGVLVTLTVIVGVGVNVADSDIVGVGVTGVQSIIYLGYNCPLYSRGSHTNTLYPKDINGATKSLFILKSSMVTEYRPIAVAPETSASIYVNPVNVEYVSALALLAFCMIVRFYYKYLILCFYINIHHIVINILYYFIFLKLFQILCHLYRICLLNVF